MNLLSQNSSSRSKRHVNFPLVQLANKPIAFGKEHV